jgi:nucleotide-binding universal stress UspA family protein
MLRFVTGKLVLVAVDDSPASDAAIGASLELAAALGSGVRIVHVSSHLAERLFASDPESGPTQAELAQGDAILGRALERATAAGVAAELELVGGDGDTGDIAAIVSGIADGLGAGMIVCGSRGRAAAVGAVLGSVSHNLIRYANVPVLIVHAPEGAGRS